MLVMKGLLHVIGCLCTFQSFIFLNVMMTARRCLLLCCSFSLAPPPTFACCLLCNVGSSRMSTRRKTNYARLLPFSASRLHVEAPTLRRSGSATMATLSCLNKRSPFSDSVASGHQLLGCVPKERGPLLPRKSRIL